MARTAAVRDAVVLTAQTAVVLTAQTAMVRSAVAPIARAMTVWPAAARRRTVRDCLLLRTRGRPGRSMRWTPR